MLNTDLPVPFLSIKRLEIARRLIVKEVLRTAFKDAGVTHFDGPKDIDTHGEFGTVEYWIENKQNIKNKIKQNLENNSDLNSVINHITIGISGLDKDEIKIFIQQDLFSQIEESIKGQSSNMGLAEALAEKKSFAHVWDAFTDSLSLPRSA